MEKEVSKVDGGEEVKEQKVRDGWPFGGKGGKKVRQKRMARRGKYVTTSSPPCHHYIHTPIYVSNYSN